MCQQRIIGSVLLCSLLLDGIEINRLQEQVDAGAGAGNELPVIRGDAESPLNLPIEVSGIGGDLGLDQLAENRLPSITEWNP
jgi:hypothetical protein